MGFGADILKAGRKTLELTNNQAKKVAVILSENVINDTPVKTGRLKGSWHASINAPFFTDAIRFDPTGNAAKAEAKLTASRLPDTSDWIFYLTNAAPYAFRIEYLGWSQQAPNGMVRTNIAKLPMLIRQALSEGTL